MQQDFAFATQIDQPGLHVMRIGRQQSPGQRAAARIGFSARTGPGRHSTGRHAVAALQTATYQGRADRAAADNPDKPSP